MSNLFNWLLNQANTFAQLMTWLTEPLKYVNLTPLEIFSVAGLTFFIGIHLVRLFVN